MTPYFLDGLFYGIVIGAGLGLFVGLVVIPAIVDVTRALERTVRHQRSVRGR